MKDNKEKSNNFEPLFAGTVCLLLGYGWFSFWSEDGVDVFWIGDLVGWFFYVFGVLGIISGIIGYLKDIFLKKRST